MRVLAPFKPLPEENPFPLTVKSNTGEDIKITTFRYPAKKGKLKGVMFYLCGLGEHCSRHERLFEEFSDEGIEVLSYDR